jgi:hypothetical protein
MIGYTKVMPEGLHQSLLDLWAILIAQTTSKRLYLNGVAWRLDFTKVMRQGLHQCLSDPKDIPLAQTTSNNLY